MNWQSLISEIQSSGLSQVQLAKRLGKSQAWVSAVSQGKYQDIRWADGQALIALADSLRETKATVTAEICPNLEKAT